MNEGLGSAVLAGIGGGLKGTYDGIKHTPEEISRTSRTMMGPLAPLAYLSLPFAAPVNGALDGVYTGLKAASYGYKGDKYDVAIAKARKENQGMNELVLRNYDPHYRKVRTGVYVHSKDSNINPRTGGTNTIQTSKKKTLK